MCAGKLKSGACAPRASVGIFRSAEKLFEEIKTNSTQAMVVLINFIITPNPSFGKCILIGNEFQQARHRLFVQALFQTGGHDRIADGLEAFEIGPLDDVLDIGRVFERDRSLVFTPDKPAD